MLTVRRTKFAKSRQVPLHPSTVQALLRYRRLRASYIERSPEGPFFVGTRGTRLGQRLQITNVDLIFAGLRKQLGWVNRGAHHAPRIHDLRHNSATRIIPSAASIDAALSEVTGRAGSERYSELSEALQEIHNAVAGSVARYRDFLGSRIGQRALL